MMYPHPHPPYMWTDPHHTHTHPSHRPPYQPWPYPVPQLPHGGCCNHPYYYYYGASPYTFHPHYPPPPPPSFFPHGLYSPYSVPPPHYSVEHPRYEYDKNNHHSCACNHHDKRPEESQADNKTSDSMAPLLSKDRHDYPIMWLPHGYTESKANDKENYSNEPVSVNHTELSKQVESQVDNKTSDSLVPLLLKDRPDYPIMWVPRSYLESKANDKDKYSHEPVSLKPTEPLKQGRNGEVDQDEQDKRFPFKIFWLPSKNDQVGKETKENNLDLVANNEGSPSARTMKNNERSGSDGQRETSSKHAAQATANEEAANKDAVQKVIPVKEASTNEEKKNLKSIDTNSDSVGKTDNGSRASPKASKLPPVCLRIDPLPKKKKSSRSPSPAEKGRSNESPVNSPKPSQQQAQVLKVEQANLADHANKVEKANLVNHGDMPKEKGDESKTSKVKEKKNISEHDAALIIQSVYRGFEVRKSQPLKKLKQINEVRKQVSELRNRIQDLETSSSTTSFDGKKSVIIGETIMSLLLKLDTIQGLHPFVREVRKSVAKELVGLQEKLDSLVKYETQSEGTNCSPQPVMHPDDGKLDQAQVQTGLCENHEHEYDAEACNTHNVEQQLEKTEEENFDQAPTKSDTVICENHEHKDDSEACNTPSVEQQLEKNAEQDKFDQATSESDAIICENHEVEATVSQEGCNTIGEPQLESHEEKFHQTLTECDEVKATESQEGCNTAGERQLESHKEKIDQAPAECDGATASKEGGDTIGEPQLGSNKELFDQAPTECDGAVGVCENNEVRTATELQEGCNTVEEPSHEEKLDQAATECNEALEFHKEHHEVEATETQEGCNIIGEPQLDSHEENLDQAPTECDEALGLHKENHEVEATELKEGCNTSDELQLESHKDQATVECDEALGLYEENRESHEDCHMVDESYKEKCDQVASECDVEANDNDDDNTGEVNNKQPESEDLANAESMMQADDKKNVVESGDVQTDMVSEKANEGDERLMQENEKLRAAVEELMKAGNDQLGVIRELTGRVKDLEKKLSKKKRKVKVNKGRRVRDCVV